MFLPLICWSCHQDQIYGYIYQMYGSDSHACQHTVLLYNSELHDLTSLKRYAAHTGGSLEWDPLASASVDTLTGLINDISRVERKTIVTQTYF